MKKIFDYYYLVLLRGFSEQLDHRVIGLMAFTFVLNLFSVAVVLDPRFLENDYFLISTMIIIGIMLLFYCVLIIIYNKQRREKIIKEYEDEGRESRQWGVFKVVLYEIFSVAFFIFAIWLTAPK